MGQGCSPHAGRFAGWKEGRAEVLCSCNTQKLQSPPGQKFWELVACLNQIHLSKQETTQCCSQCSTMGSLGWRVGKILLSIFLSSPTNLCSFWPLAKQFNLQMSKLYNGAVNTFHLIGNLLSDTLWAKTSEIPGQKVLLYCYNYDFVCNCMFVNMGQEVWENTINQGLWKNVQRKYIFWTLLSLWSL